MESFKSYRHKVWVKQSEYDLEVARISFNSAYYEWACFQAEQSAEKAMKGLMVYCGFKPPKVHKLSILFKIIKKLRPDINAKLNIEALQAFTFVSRYPFIIPGDDMTPHNFITIENAQECITQAEGVLTLINSILSKNHEKD